MPKAGYTAKTEGTVALAAATAKSILSVIAPATFGIDLRSVAIGFDGVTASNAPVLVEIVSFTTDGTGTAGTVNQAYGRSITAGFTTKHNYTVEPTTATALDEFSLSPNGGLIIRDWPPNEGFDAAVSNLIVVRLTAPAIVNARATMKFERC
jgi:hypothetical protein